MKKIWLAIDTAQLQVVVLDCNAVPNIEYTALKQLEVFEARLRSAGILLWPAALNREAFETV